MDWPDLESWDRRDEMETRGSDIPKSFFFFKLQIAISNLVSRAGAENFERVRKRGERFLRTKLGTRHFK